MSNEFKKTNLSENKEMSEDEISCNDTIEASLKAFDISLSNLHMGKTNFQDSFVKIKNQKLYDMGLFDSFDKRLFYLYKKKKRRIENR